MNPIIKNLLKFGIGIAILVYLVSRVGVKEALVILPTIDLTTIGLVFLAYFVFFILSTLCIKVLSDQYRKIKFWRLFRYGLYAWTMGLLLPSKIGELSLTYYLKQEGIKINDGAAIFLVDKFITLTLFLTVLTIGGGILLKLPLGLIIILALLVVLMLVSYKYIEWIIKLTRKVLPNKIEKYLNHFFKSLVFLLKERKKAILKNLGITIVRWIMINLVFYLIFLSIGININILLIALITFAIAIIALIPISPSGLGIRESAGVYFYSQIGINPAAAVDVFLIYLVITYGLTAICFFAIMKEGFSWKKLIENGVKE